MSINRAMMGKANTIFFRLCLVLQAIHVACDALVNVAGSNDIEYTRQMEMECRVIISHNSHSYFTIDVGIVKQAIELTDYFNKNKLLLSSYILDPMDSLDDIIEQYFQQHNSKPVIAGPFLNCDQHFLRLLQKIMNLEQNVMAPLDVNKGNLPKVPVIVSAFDFLVKHGMGTTKCIVAKNRTVVTYFTKISSQTIRESPELGEVVQNMGLVLADLIKLLFNTETAETSAKVLRAERKRKADDSGNSTDSDPSNEQSTVAMTSKKSRTSKQPNAGYSKRFVFEYDP
jgi:hypothetical protein